MPPEIIYEQMWEKSTLFNVMCVVFKIKNLRI